MKKLILTALFVVLVVFSANAQSPLFYGGSANFTGGANLFAGYQITPKLGIIGTF